MPVSRPRGRLRRRRTRWPLGALLAPWFQLFAHAGIPPGRRARRREPPPQYRPNGAAECARRRRQIAAGMLDGSQLYRSRLPR